MDTEYDPKELEALVETALNDIKESDSSHLFSFGDTQVLKHLDGILNNYVNKAESSNILDELRTKLLDGIAGQNNSANSLRSLHAIVNKCRVCPHVEPNPQLPKWNLSDPDVVFVLDYPIRGLDSDKFFVDQLKNAGFRSSRLAVTSTVRCFPGDKNRRPPYPEEISNCSTRYLFNELRLLKPRLIVAAGNIPSSVLTGDKLKITEERGSIFWIGPWPIMVVYSPAYAMRSEKQQSEFESDLKKANEFLYGK